MCGSFNILGTTVFSSRLLCAKQYQLLFEQFLPERENSSSYLLFISSTSEYMFAAHAKNLKIESDTLYKIYTELIKYKDRPREIPKTEMRTHIQTMVNTLINRAT
jgi:hypothetical protein